VITPAQGAKLQSRDGQVMAPRRSTWFSSTRSPVAPARCLLPAGVRGYGMPQLARRRRERTPLLQRSAPANLPRMSPRTANHRCEWPSLSWSASHQPVGSATTYEQSSGQLQRVSRDSHSPFPHAKHTAKLGGPNLHPSGNWLVGVTCTLTARGLDPGQHRAPATLPSSSSPTFRQRL
jgi:hypothetical protein